MQRILYGGAVLAALFLGGLCGATAVEIRLEGAGNAQVFRVAGWTGAVPEAGAASWQDVFAVYVDGGEVPLLGSYRVENAALTFQPRFALRPGLRYRAVFKPAALVSTFEIPKGPPTPATKVERVYPSTNLLPENQLKLYVHFSAPMSRGEAYRRLRLLDQSGGPVELPFLELAEELWDREGKRLTILFDPGRVKQGLRPRQEVGSPLESGREYTLAVDREWPDAEGRPLREAFLKRFRVGPPDHELPALSKWRLRPPKSGGSEPLTVELPEPLDRALLEGLIDVTDPRGNSLPGSIQVGREETRWLFTPREPWKAGRYYLTVGATLEDLAGNTIERPFEVDVFERIDERISRVTRRLPFQIGEHK